MDYIAQSERTLWDKSCISTFSWWRNWGLVGRMTCLRFQSWEVAIRALGTQALFSRAHLLFLTWLFYLGHQNALLWILKWALRLPRPLPLGSLIHAMICLVGGSLGFREESDSPNPSLSWGAKVGVYSMASFSLTPHGTTMSWVIAGTQDVQRCKIQGHICICGLKITFFNISSFFCFTPISFFRPWLFSVLVNDGICAFLSERTLPNSRSWSYPLQYFPTISPDLWKFKLPHPQNPRME